MYLHMAVSSLSDGQAETNMTQTLVVQIILVHRPCATWLFLWCLVLGRAVCRLMALVMADQRDWGPEPFRR